MRRKRKQRISLEVKVGLLGLVVAAILAGVALVLGNPAAALAIGVAWFIGECIWFGITGLANGL
jgi:hypothetical protein